MKSIIFTSLVFVWMSNPAALAQSLTGADCLTQTCGPLKLSYPFKLKSHPNCPSFSPFFELECISEDLFLHNFTHNDLDVPLKVLHIQSDSLIVDATGFNVVSKPLENGTCSTEPFTSLALPVFPGPFVFADDNLFASFGCTMGIVVGAELLKNTSASEPLLSNVELGGCCVLCQGNEMNPECEGRTCCISSLAHGASFRGVVYLVTPSPFNIGNEQFNSAPCNNNNATVFDPNYTNFSNNSYGLKINWALPLNQTSSIMDIQKSSNFACSNHSSITIVQEVPGYRCSCQHGFDGDGYSLGLGCSDVDECAIASLNECIPGKSTCHNNVEGSYTCKCNSRYHVGDGMRNGSGCKFSPTLRNVFAIIGAIVFLSSLVAGFVIFAIYWRRKIKQKYFLLNGGVQLQHIISKARGKQDLSSRLFSAEELKAATDNYADHMKLGMGGFGTVYKGVLADGRLVAIKKANRTGHGGGNDQFLNEMQILMQINHRNIVRLLGCCLETAVPLLVYELVAHGNVRENLDMGDPGFMTWAQRLKVARQTAEALAYLHAAASPPILHRDVKSANVLLDDNLDAKVADFGASRLVPDGVQHVSTAVQGTIGYLDPEYFQTLQLTDKSDVYSLGVMLVELITGLKPVDSQGREPGLANLALLFINRMQEARGEELIDSHLQDPSTLPSDKPWDLAAVRSSIMAVAELARRCLALRGADRPSMNLLADELRYITRSLENFDSELDDNENSPLMPRKPKHSKHLEAGAVLKQDADFVVQSAYSSMSIHDLNLDMTTLPR